MFLRIFIFSFLNFFLTLTSQASTSCIDAISISVEDAEVRSLDQKTTAEPFNQKLTNFKEQLKQDGVSELVSYSFRQTVFEPDPFQTHGSQEQFKNTIQSFFPFELTLSTQELVLLWNMKSAFDKREIDTYLNDEELIFLLYALRGEVSEDDFAGPNIIPEVSLDQLNGKLPGVRNRIKIALSEPKRRVVVSNFLKSKDVIIALHTVIQTMVGPEQHDELYAMLDRFDKKSYQIKNNTLGLQDFHRALELTMIVIFSENFSSSRSNERSNQGGALITNELETSLYTMTKDPNSTPILQDLFEFVLSNLPLPLKPEAWLHAVERELRVLEIPEIEETTSNQSTVTIPTTSTLNSSPNLQPRTTAQPERNPRKRRNQRGRRRNEARQNTESDTVETNTTQDQVLEMINKNSFPEPEINYTTFFMRNSHMGEQFLIFTSDSLKPFSQVEGLEVVGFLRAFHYGYTARDGSNGIKKLKASRKLNGEYYELKPGKSDFRLVLSKTGNVWTVIQTIHKDKLDNYVDGLD